jgi:hypothetical protein
MPTQKNKTPIDWTGETWYSRIAAIVVFVGIVPAIGFFVGVRYSETVNTINNSAMAGLEMIRVQVPAAARASALETQTFATTTAATSSAAH